jgi:hypothetical protein
MTTPISRVMFPIFPVGCGGVCELACLPFIEDPPLYVLCYYACYDIWVDN